MAHNTEQSIYVKQHTLLEIIIDNHVQMYDMSKAIYN